MAESFFFLFVFLKQFYLFDSGGIGIADVCMGICFVILFRRKKKRKNCLTKLKQEKYLMIFFGGVFLINSIYALKDGDWNYELYVLYWGFNIASIWCFQELCTKRFLSGINCIFKVNLILQFGIYLTGYGRVFVENWGGRRYMGTFNDPNQFAFYLFAMLLIICLYACYFKDITALLFYVISILLIGESKSTGVFVGIIFLTVGMLMYGIIKICRRKVLSKSIQICFIAIITVAVVMCLILIIPPAYFDIHNTDYTMIARIQEKIWKVLYGNNSTILADRGLDKVILYPEYLIWGAGEGGFNRFALAVQQNEIHCSFINIWFCYGVVPLTMLGMWIGGKIKGLSTENLIIVVSLFAESLFLVNYRQPLFWMVIVYGSMVREKMQDGENVCPNFWYMMKRKVYKINKSLRGLELFMN